VSGWFVVKTYVLDGSTLELHPEYGSDFFFVYDTRSKKTLTSALPLKTAKKSAEYRLKHEPAKYSKPAGEP